MRFLPLAAILAAVPLAAQISGDERRSLIAYLESTLREVEAEAAELAAEQLAFRPAPGRWTIAECVEHIALAESVFRRIVDGLLQLPPRPAAKPEAQRREEDEAIPRLARDRGKKGQAPEAGVPAGRPVAESLAILRRDRAATIDFVRTTAADLRAHRRDSPVLRDTDAYQWLLLAGGHAQRHLDQIRELKADAAFPRGR